MPPALPRPRVVRHPARAVVGGFTAAILVGAGLLSLPAATVAPGGAPFDHAVFTSTSAVTVTGLITVDTATYWTPFGQAVILGLIQLGGIGIMTSASLLVLALARRIGLRSRLVAQSERSASLGDLRRLVIAIVVVSLVAEAVTAAIIGSGLWVDGRPVAQAAWEGVFHGVSAFNNAGFSLYSDSLMGFATDGWMLLTVALAVIAGGLGFPVWMDVRRRPLQPGRWSVHTKLTLATTGALIAFGTVALTALEWTNEATLGAMGAPGRLLNGFFAAVMPRTAGFNAMDYGQMEPDGLLITDMLMFAGGGSGSTAGGIKVTTFALLFLIVWAELRGDRDVGAFRRAIPAATQRQALAIAALSVNVVVIATLVLVAGSGLTLGQALFESLSAFSTVGLSTGVTGDLDALGRWLLVPLMLAGRIGPLTLGLALVLRERERLYSHPEERPIVG